jgi:hypothetical protein
LNSTAYQLGFASDGTLYAHSAGDGNFFTLDTQTGDVTNVFNSGGYTDLTANRYCYCECSTIVTNTATLTCAEDQSLVSGSPASASFAVICSDEEFPPTEEPGDFCTQTQGGWGSTAAGNNTGKLRDTYFDTVFPNGICLGDNWDSFTSGADCTDGPVDGYSIYLGSSLAVEEYLPCSGGGCTPAALTADLTDPETTSSGNLGTQLTAATLNVAFDAAGYGKCDIDPGIDCSGKYPDGTLGTLVYGGCVATNLQGKTVNEVIALANTAISGQGLPTGVTFSDLNDALSKLNEEFVDCDTVATGCLTVPSSPE